MPDRNLAAVLEPRDAPGDAPRVEDAVAAALADPLDAPRLVDAAADARRVLVLVDDATRATPVARILPRVAGALAEGGVRDDDVTVLTAQGTHRRMTRDELTRKLGPAFLARWRVRQHDWRDRESLTAFGATRGGMPVVANRLLEDADLVVGIGQVGVHGILGYSGGAKIVLPGVCGHETEAWTHWTATASRHEDLMGVTGNPLRREIEEGARRVGLDAVLNVSLDPSGRVAHAAYGDLVSAQRACARVARDLHAVPLDGPVDVVVTDATPADRDYWQSAKGLYAASVAVKDGGVIVLACPNPEGVAGNHPNVVDLAGKPFDEIRARVENGEEDVIGAAVAAYTARIRERARVILVSTGIADADARRMGFTPARTVQDGLDEAFRHVPPDASVAVFRHGGGLLPVVPGRNDHRVAVAGTEPSRAL